jgi:group II intron reverse transcriptase/maturase
MMRLSDLAEPGSLATLFARVRSRSAAAGADGVSPETFARGLDERLATLSAALRAETWQPSALVRLRREKAGGGVRVLSIPTVEDRIVIELLRTAIDPEVEPLLSRVAYAYRPRRSAREAVDAVAARISDGARWIAHADIRDFFDTIRIDGVIDAVQDFVPDPALVRLLGRVLRRHAFSPGRGLAQGSALSPLLSNLALLPLDRRLCAAGFDLVRYSDNLCIAAKTRAEAEEGLRAIESEARRLGLSLKREASAVAEVRAGVLWLGFWLGEGGHRAGDGAVRALRSRVEKAARRLQGAALRERLAPIVHGWAQYFDAPLPEGVDLGPHDALVRALLAERLGAAAQPAVNAAPEGADAPLPAADIDAEGPGLDAWDDDWREAEAGEGSEDLLAQAERLAAGGDYAAAENAYQRAQHPSPEAGAATPVPVPSDPEIDDETIDAFLGLFAAGQDAFEAAPHGSQGKRDLAAVPRPPGPADVHAHLAGRTAMAIQPRLPDGTCALGVVDIDAPDAAGLTAARAHAGALAAVAESRGFRILVEETGGRGLHLWLPFEGRPRADDVARVLASLRAEAGAPKDGIRVEALPAADDAPDLHVQSITLPLGLHLETGERSRLRWAHGPVVGADLRGLFEGRPNELPIRLDRVPDSVLVTETEPRAADAPAGALGQDLPAWSSFGAAVEHVMTGCAVLRHLARKAASVGHLSHGERLSLLYTLGHLGPNGHQAIHAIIARCNNYDAAETSRQIARLSGLPIGCARMREKHVTPELLPLCCCDFGDVAARGGYPTPLLHATGFRHAWRAVLRRREEEARVRPPALVGVRAVPERSLGERPSARRDPSAQRPAATQVNTSEPGVLVRGAPPHEWA